MAVTTFIYSLDCPITGNINYYESSHAAGKELNILATSIRNNICGLSNVVSKRYKFYS